MVFDQGNNSKKILSTVDEDLHFVGALSPTQHKTLVEMANTSMNQVVVGNKDSSVAIA